MASGKTLRETKTDEDSLFEATLEEINLIWSRRSYSLKAKRELINKLLPGTFKVKLTRE